MNKYTHTFEVNCPNNDRTVTYRLVIKAKRIIMVEDIIAECVKFKSSFHEPMADALLARFGGKQKLKAYHHGVGIRTKRK